MGSRAEPDAEDPHAEFNDEHWLLIAGMSASPAAVLELVSPDREDTLGVSKAGETGYAERHKCRLTPPRRGSRRNLDKNAVRLATQAAVLWCSDRTAIDTMPAINSALACRRRVCPHVRRRLIDPRRCTRVQTVRVIDLRKKKT